MSDNPTPTIKKEPGTVIKQEPGTSDQAFLTRPGRSKSASKKTSESTPNRLPSLRGPRDLTLGGIKKKTFSPNIPIRKDRTKLEVKQEVKPATDGRQRRPERSNTPRQRGRGRGFRNKEIIQSHSIFEAGPAGEANRKGRDAQSHSEPASNQMQKPTIKKESFDPALEKAESEEVMKRLEEGNLSLIADLQNDEKLKPTTLPMQGTQTQNFTKIKTEPGIMRDMKHPSNCASIFSGGYQYDKLVVFQLPDVLPGIVPSREDEKIHVKQEPGTQKKDGNKTKDKEEEKCDLASLSEGKIGKIQVLKSGKCRLILGNVVLNLKTGVSSCFSEELISVKLPPEDSPSDIKGHVSVLGSVDHKLICCPDIESLLK
uniref:DNA-directed RNA polymerase III subunit RPC4 n=1 Tax=Phallusia mammillata TaxID=59560 RepID=A0A6F9DPX2_9ASCI|nr:DNA-directed RNA polymerase III subunit RPC4 [Phallusia mammillata]